MLLQVHELVLESKMNKQGENLRDIVRKLSQLFGS